MFLDAWESVAIAGTSFTQIGDSVLVEVTQTSVGTGSHAPVTAHYFQLWTFRGGKVIRIDSIKEKVRALEAAGLR